MEAPERSRRASVHSVTMSSGSNSRASSIGPSSFTENLTLYMNGERNPFLSLEHRAESADEAATKQIESVQEYHGDLQALRDELQATLKRHNELMAENERLRRNLEETAAKASQVQPLEEELQQGRATIRETGLQLEAAQRQAEVNVMRVEELQQEVSKQTALTRQARDSEAGHVKKIEALERELERQEENNRDELDDQSLIDELEDDLERTRHELDKAIKDRKRVERQLDFTKSDFEVEKKRVKELEEQLSEARATLKARNDSTTQQPVQSQPTPSQEGQEVAGDSNPSKAGIEMLQVAMDRAELRIDGLESQLEIANFQMQQNSDAIKAANEAKKSSQAADALVTGSEKETAMDRAEDYIRKLKAQEKSLKEDLQEMTIERDDLRLRLRDAENILKETSEQNASLTDHVQQLEVVKERMGRVLMYQWGKEEVGEIERHRNDGKREKGMGFKYKYFNKDGSVKVA